MEDDYGTVVQRPRYSAFISYSHADAALVRKLHAKLEAYRLPKGVGRNGARKTGKHGIGKVFRDREDLSAAENLSDAVTDALNRSEVLVVVCSPDARASRWVGQEIAFFREHCPGRPILAAIVRGEPAAAFPELLTEGGIEPLAADLREEGDGWRLGFLKVVAGIAGVPLDALVQRDSQRQMRRVMAVTGATALVAIVMGAMTMFAIQARAEAEEQRDAAEDLVGFMMTDLREELRKVGSIETMASVSSRALEYYEQERDLSGLSTESLLLRAQALHGLGEDLLKYTESDKQEVRGLFFEAYRTTEALLAREPGDPEIVYRHAQSAYWVGQSNYFFRDWKGTQARWDEYLSLAEQYDALERGSDKGQSEIGYALGNLCTLALHRTDVAQDALAKCQRSTEIFAKLAKRKPDDEAMQSTLANRLGWLADAWMKAGNPARAIETYERQHEIAVSLHQKAPKDASKVDQLMRAKMTLGEALAREGRNSDASVLLSEARSLAEQMIRRDPKNQFWQDWLIRLAD